MPTIYVHHYDAFSSKPNEGNPAGVVVESSHLTESDMQSIAYQVGFNETVFICQSEIADIRLRYFTPGHEINLCGHATMAALFCLRSRGLLGDKVQLTIETNVGVLPIGLSSDEDQSLHIRMKQDHPRFVAFDGEVDALACAIGLQKEELSGDLPIVYGSTGAWTLLVPIKKLDSFQRMVPDQSAFPGILTHNPKSSIHPFCMETINSDAFMHARHFSSPYSGTIEDPVTGTASGVMGAYYLKYINKDIDSAVFVVEQGQEIGRDGRVKVEVLRTNFQQMDVYVSGTAVFIQDMKIEY